MNTLFKSKVSRKSVLATAQEKIPKTVEIKSISHGTTHDNWLMPSAFSLLVCVTAVCCCAGSQCSYVLLFADIEEKGVRMKLTVIDTPGFGDQINNENW